MREAHVGLLADLHVGSVFSTWPRDFPTANGIHQLTGYQAWLLDRFNETVEAMPRLDAAIIDGDLIDGENPVVSGRGTITPDPAEQAAAAIELLRPLRKKARRLFLVRGTPFHEGASHEGLELVGSELRCERWGAGNRYSDLFLERKWMGHTLNVTHHQTTGFIYALGGASKEAMYAAIAEADKGANHADIIVRAHTHTDGMGFVNGRWVIFLPSWCFTTPYAQKRMGHYRAMASNALGAVLLSEDGTGLRVKPIRHVPPSVEVVDL